MALARTRQARRLRSAMTRAEVKLWSQLKQLRAAGFHFRRQAPFNAYFLDFVCFDRRLVIELDGSHHADEVQAEHDRIRDRVLERQGFQVLRFWNSELEHLERAMEVILQALADQLPTRLDAARRATLPIKGRD
jgi:very-short-patch-repair endonuclease